MKLKTKIKNKVLQLLNATRKDDYGHDPRLNNIINILDKGLGHKHSFETSTPVDYTNKPLPWFTYPAINYLQQLDFSTLSILEWGMGYSTLFFAPLCRHILSVEHNIEWYNIISPSMPENATVKLFQDSQYELYPTQIDEKFDVIIIDGIKRPECIKSAVEILRDGGIIIFDNSDRDPNECAFLRSKDLIQVDFHGFGPANAYTWTTSVFFSRNSRLKPKTIQPTIPIGGGY